MYAMTDEEGADAGWEQTASCTASALNVSSRRTLANYLNPPLTSLSSDDRQQDWQGLAELCEFVYNDIQNFKLKEDPFNVMFEQWTTNKHHTLGDLHRYLQLMERYDILEDVLLSKRIVTDVKKYKQRQEQMQREADKQRQQAEAADMPDEVRNHYVDEYKHITVKEVETGEPEYFDAYVCAAREDFFFVKQMIHMLEEVHHLKLCVIERDLMPGVAKYTAIAKLISDRCKKMVIILSPDYVRSPLCDFQTKFAQAMSPGARDKKLIPVLIRNPCPLPQILSFINPLDFTKSDIVEWFWTRLARSLEEPLPPTLTDQQLFELDSSQQLPVTRLTPEELNMEVPLRYYEGRARQIPLLRELSLDPSVSSEQGLASSTEESGPIPLPKCAINEDSNSDDSHSGLPVKTRKKKISEFFFSKKKS